VEVGAGRVVQPSQERVLAGRIRPVKGHPDGQRRSRVGRLGGQLRKGGQDVAGDLDLRCWERDAPHCGRRRGAPKDTKGAERERTGTDQRHTATQHGINSK